VEVPTSGGGNSVTMRLIDMIDRSDEIILSSSTSQVFTGKLFIAGTIKGESNSGIQIAVIGPDNSIIFGPKYVNTNYMGDFSSEVPMATMSP
jgi:hypothetical protein